MLGRRGALLKFVALPAVPIWLAVFFVVHR